MSVLGTAPTKRDAKPYLSRSAPSAHHVALVKVAALQDQPDHVIDGLARTLSYLNRLGLGCLVVLDAQSASEDAPAGASAACPGRARAFAQADRLVSALETFSNTKASRQDDLFALDLSTSPAVQLQYPRLLARTLRRGVIPVLAPIAFESESQRLLDVPPDDLVMALTRSFAGHGPSPLYDEAKAQTAVHAPAPFMLDRIIVLDPAGAIPSAGRADAAHVFINMEQEYDDIRAELAGAFPTAPRATIRRHLRNLLLLQRTLALLPPTSSALLAAPEDAASPAQARLSALSVGTRRFKNPLISSLLTDKPLISSSLPPARLTPSTKRPTENEPTASSPASSAVASAEDTAENTITPLPRRPAVTFAKRGMPLTMLPDPRAAPWTPPAPGEQGMSLEDSGVDLKRLLALIDDSFGRTLDPADYLARLRGRTAGVIVAGDYEGGAVVTWETPPGGGDSARLVPYLDKFAVARRSQGAGGVADVVFGALVRACLPAGVVWRSRRSNPVNRWYFERAVGSWKLPGAEWTMFWTTPGMHGDAERWADCEAVCRGVKPSWKDGGADH